MLFHHLQYHQSHRPRGSVLRTVLRWVGPTVRLRTSADFAGLSLLSQKSLGDSPSQKCLLAQRSCTTGQSCAAARYTVPVTINEHAARVWQHELKRPALWTGLTKHLPLRLIASKKNARRIVEKLNRRPYLPSVEGPSFLLCHFTVGRTVCGKFIPYGLRI